MPEVTETNDKKDIKQFKPVFKPIYVIYLLVAIAGFFIAKFVLGSLAKKAEVKPPAPEEQKPVPAVSEPLPPAPAALPSSAAEEQIPPPESPQEKAKPELSLNGIFIDREKPYAIINNQVVKEGDIIGGAKVVTILLNGVVLEFEGEPIELRIAK